MEHLFQDEEFVEAKELHYREEVQGGRMKSGGQNRNHEKKTF